MYHNQAREEQHVSGLPTAKVKEQLTSLPSHGKRSQNRQSSEEMLAEINQLFSPGGTALGRLTSTIDNNAKTPTSRDAREANEHGRAKRSKAYMHMPK